MEQNQSVAAGKLTKKDKIQLKRLKKEQLQEQAVRDEMTREAILAKQTYNKCRRRWKQMVVDKEKIRAKEVMFETWKTFEKANDTKDAMIEKLSATLDQTEMLSLQSRQDCSEIINKAVKEVIGVFLEMKREAAKHKSYFQAISEDLTIQDEKEHEKKIADMKTIIVAQTLKTNDHIYAECLTKLEEEVSKHRSECEIMLMKVVKKMGTVFKDYKETLDDYRQNVEKMEIKNAEMEVKVGQSDKTKRSQANRIVRLLTKMERYNDFLRAGGSRHDVITINNLTREYDELRNKYLILNQKYSRISDVAAKKTKRMLTAWHKVIDNLEAAKSKVQKVVQLGRLCHRYEIKSETKPKSRHKYRYPQVGLGTVMNFWQYKCGRAELVHNLMWVQRQKLLKDKVRLERQLEKGIALLNTLIPDKVSMLSYLSSSKHK